MSTTTAVALIGDAHPYHGGVSADYLLCLTENSRPSLQLFRLRADGQRTRLDLVAIWTPTVENMLEDVLLLIGTAVCGDSVLRAEVLSHVGADELSRLYISSLADEHRRKIYALLQKTKLNDKVVLTVLEGCTLLNQVDRLPEYDLDCELCISSRAAVRPLAGKE
jgi:hypothetical protein